MACGAKCAVCLGALHYKLLLGNVMTLVFCCFILSTCQVKVDIKVIQVSKKVAQVSYLKHTPPKINMTTEKSMVGR